MTCEHLQSLEKELIEKGIRETARGQVWSNNCREWVYFDCVFPDLEKTMQRLQLNTSLINIHTHRGTHDGAEHGLYCSQCHDAIMGIHPAIAEGMSVAPVKYV